MSAPTFPLWRLDRLRMGTDGEGITALVCAYGCPLRCKYCINPASTTEQTPYTFVTPEELFAQVRRDGLYYSATGGGVTFGGGEPLTHAPFIAAFQALIPADWHIYAETSLQISPENLRLAAKAVDRFFVDVKETDPRIYRRYTGGDNSLVLQNLRLLADLAGADRVTVRLPLIPGCNTDRDRDASQALLEEWGFTRFDRFDYVIPSERAKGK